MTQAILKADHARIRLGKAVAFLFVSLISISPSLVGLASAQEIEATGDLVVKSTADSVLLEEADSNIFQGDQKLAVDKYTVILSRYPNNARALFNRASARILAGDYGNALEDLQRAASLFEKRGKLKLRNRALSQIMLIRSLQNPASSPK